MRKVKWQLLILLCAIGGIVAIEEVMFWGPSRRARAQVDATDKVAILTACRQLMADCATYTTEERETHFLADWVVVNRGSPQYNRMPQVLKDLKPRAVLIRTNQVTLLIRPFPSRVYLYAYAQGASQGGNVKIVDGLWN